MSNYPGALSGGFISHRFQSLKSDLPDLSVINPLNWNQSHIIGSGAIQSGALGASTVNSGNVSTNAITSGSIAALSVTSGAIASGATSWNLFGPSKPFVTVTPNGPTDGGDYGPNTVGTTTAGIQEAINSLASGGTVYIARGTFLTNSNALTQQSSDWSSINIRTPNITVRGIGASSIIKLASGQNCGVFGVGDASGGVAVTNVTLADFLLDGNSANQTGGPWQGLRIGRRGAAVSNVTCYGLWTQNCGLVNGPYFVSPAEECVAVACHSNNAGDAGFAFYGAVRCTFDSCTSNNDVEGVGVYHNTVDCSIVNLLTNGDKDNGVYIAGDAGGVQSNTRIVNPMIYNMVGGGSFAGVGISDLGVGGFNGTGAAVIGGVIDTALGGIGLDGANSSIVGTTIILSASATHNVMQLAGGHGIVKGCIAVSATPGTRLEVDGDYNLIEGNLFENATTPSHGIALKGNYNLVRNNRIRNNGGDAILFGTNIRTGNIIEGNDVTGNSAYFDFAGTQTTIRENPPYNPVGNVTSPINSGVIGIVGVSGTAAIGSGITYQVQATDLFISSISGNPSIVVTGSGGGSALVSGASSIIGMYLPIGSQISWGSFTSSPTVTVFAN